jgi:hypothetical protein
MTNEEWFNWCGGNQKVIDMIYDIIRHTPYTDNHILDTVNKVQSLGLNLSLEEIISLIWANELPIFNLI